jgi:hypothetical protein
MKGSTAMFNQYVETALWSSIGDNEQPLDRDYSADDLSDEAKVKACNDLESFVTKAGTLLDGLDPTDVAHDFWLTRNGHGCGFWDGDYDDSIGEQLTMLSKQFGETDLYVGDDGKLYFSR